MSAAAAVSAGGALSAPLFRAIKNSISQNQVR
jgi:hypothetical protein